LLTVSPAFVLRWQPSARAEMSEGQIARQFGLPYLRRSLRGGPAMNDALLSGSVEFGSGGIYLCQSSSAPSSE
jgi:hypothetical protein